MAVSQYELNEYWAIMDELSLLATEDTLGLLRSLNIDDQQELFAALQAGVPEIVALYRDAMVENAALFYGETQGIELDREAAAASSRVVAPQLRSNLKWVIDNPGNTQIAGLLAGVVSKHVLDGGRRYAERGFAAAGAGWFRAARPGACSFCRMLATRAATDWGPYTSADAAIHTGRGPTSRSQQPKGSDYHKHCKCIPVKASEYQVPEHVNEWTETYYKATEQVGNATDYRSILAEMRRIDGHMH